MHKLLFYFIFILNNFNLVSPFHILRIIKLHTLYIQNLVNFMFYQTTYGWEGGWGGVGRGGWKWKVIDDNIKIVFSLLLYNSQAYDKIVSPSININVKRKKNYPTIQDKT